MANVFTKYLDNLSRTRMQGFTLTEILIAVTIICILVTMSTPIYSKALEQARLDTAARELKTIWTAQRVYWLDNRSYAENLITLQNLDLISSKLALSQESVSSFYVFEIGNADEEAFTAVARRNASSKWSGQIQIDEFGVLDGSISASDGTVLVPMLAD